MAKNRNKNPFRIRAGSDFVAALNECLLVKQDDDRAVALIGGSILDDCLEQYLRSRIPDKTVFDWLFNIGRPLGSFSGKIKFARASNMIGPKVHDELDRIREIRNAFAHKIFSDIPSSNLVRVSFNEREIKGKCSSLWIPRKLWSDKFTGERTPKKRYVVSLVMLSATLKHSADNPDKPIEPVLLT